MYLYTYLDLHGLLTSSPTNTSELISFLSNVFFLTVDPPKIIRHPKSKSVATGESTTFKVEATGDDLQFQWKRNGKDLLVNDRYHSTDTDTLRIIKVEKSDDKAHYQCRVKNDKGEKLSDEAVLTVSKLVINVIEMQCVWLLSPFVCSIDYIIYHGVR